MIVRLPVPPEILHRCQLLRAYLQPAVRTWMEQQARLEARRPSLDLDALRGAIRQRFASSLSSTPRQPSLTMSDPGVEALVVLIVLMLEQGYSGQIAAAQKAVAAAQADLNHQLAENEYAVGKQYLNQAAVEGLSGPRLRLNLNALEQRRAKLVEMLSSVYKSIVHMDNRIVQKMK